MLKTKEGKKMKGFCPVCEKFVDVRVESKVVNIKVKGVNVKATQKFAYCLKHNSIAYVEEIEKENDITIFSAYIEETKKLGKPDFEMIGKIEKLKRKNRRK